MVKKSLLPLYRATWRPFATFLHPLRVEGLENLPKDQPVLLCANHSSAVDPILLICAMRQDFPLRIMAKKQLMKIPVVGAFLRAIGVFGVDRGNSDIAAVKTSIQSLRDGWNLLVFPEGTRVKEPGSVDVKGGVGMMAIRSGVPLVPVFIGRDKRLFHRVSIIIGKPYDPVYTGRKGTAEEYQSNAEEIMRRAYGAGRNPMAEVRVAKSAGFCYGVERAVKLAEETAREKGGCAMLGSIIHNVHVVAELEALGARQVDSVEEVRPGETVIIRSHGERKEVFDRLEQLGARVRQRHLSQRTADPAAGGAGRPGGAYPPYHWGASASGGHGCGQLVGSQRHLSGAGRT